MDSLIDIKEKKFEIHILEWDSFTVELLKDYSNWKYNDFNNNGKNNVNFNAKSYDILKNNSKVVEKNKIVKRRIWNSLFPEKDIICKTGEYGTSCLYRPILNYILHRLPERFTIRQLSDIIHDFYKGKGWTVKKSSIGVYARSYRKYMIDNKIIKTLKDGVHFVVIKKVSNNHNDDDAVIAVKDIELTIGMCRKPPNNTSLFLNWLQTHKIFSLKDFLDDNPSIEKEHAQEIIDYQIEQKTIWQMSPTSYRRVV